MSEYSPIENMDVNAYSRYTNYVQRILDSGNIAGFKSHPDYTWMLEHVSPAQGYEYLQHINTKTQITQDEIAEFSRRNDAQGDPPKVNFGFMTASPSNLRYILHAHLFLSHVQSLKRTSVYCVELGGGYGGLCFAIHHFASKYGITITSYTIIDLPSIIKFQSMYLQVAMPSNTISFEDAQTFGANITKTNLFLVSNYCFSEISNDLQVRYRETLFPKVEHGFMAWNMIPTYPFGFQFREEQEYPKTGPFNKYVYF
jgi:hypothetical protein